MIKIRSFTSGLFVVSIAFILIGIMASCAHDTSAPELEEAHQTTAIATEDVSESAENGQEDFTDQECLDCHTNQTLLAELAPPAEDPEESLSSGPG